MYNNTLNVGRQSSISDITVLMCCLGPDSFIVLEEVEMNILYIVLCVDATKRQLVACRLTTHVVPFVSQIYGYSFRRVQRLRTSIVFN